MRTILATSVLAVVAGAAAAQTANQIGFVKSINTTYTDRMSNTTQDIDALVHFDDRDYLEWMLDPTDPTGATYKFTGMKFVIQDQVGTTLENFTVAAYNEDPLNPDTPDANGLWVRSGPFSLPASTVTGAVAWIYTITMPTAMASAPKGDKFIGVGLTLPLSGGWPADGCSLHMTFDRTLTGTTANSDLPGAGIASAFNTQLCCTMPVVAGVPTGPAAYPVGNPGSRRQLNLEILANVTGGVAITQTNQTLYTCSNPGNVNTPLGGTTNLLSGINPDVYDVNTAGRADNIGFLVTDVNFANAPTFVILAFGPSIVGTVPLSALSSSLAAPGTRGNMCVDFAFGLSFFGLTNAAGLYQQNVNLTPGARTVLQGMSPRDIWWQGFVMNVAGSTGGLLELHATGCAKQHI